MCNINIKMEKLKFFQSWDAKHRKSIAILQLKRFRNKSYKSRTEKYKDFKIKNRIGLNCYAIMNIFEKIKNSAYTQGNHTVPILWYLVKCTNYEFSVIK